MGNLKFSLPHFIFWKWMPVLIVMCIIVIIRTDKIKMGQSNDMLMLKTRFLEEQLRTPVNSVAVNRSQALQTHFAYISGLPNIASELQELVIRNGLVLSAVSYKPIVNTTGEEIGGIEIDVNLKGTYRSLKFFFSELLAAHKELALESISLRRNRSTDVVVDVELRFTYFYRKGV